MICCFINKKIFVIVVAACFLDTCLIILDDSSIMEDSVHTLKVGFPNVNIF